MHLSVCLFLNFVSVIQLIESVLSLFRLRFANTVIIVDSYLVFDRSAAASYGSSGRYRVSGEDSALSDC